MAIRQRARGRSLNWGIGIGGDGGIVDANHDGLIGEEITLPGTAAGNGVSIGQRNCQRRHRQATQTPDQEPYGTRRTLAGETRRIEKSLARDKPAIRCSETLKKEKEHGTAAPCSL